MEAGGGTWVTLPMGHVRQPLNTFWQLLYRPTGSGPWSDDVEATAVATNGGIVLASATGRPLIAGVRPTDLLRFSPLVFTADGGRSWSNGVIPEGLAARPGALSTASDGSSLALVQTAHGAQVLVSTGDLSAWRVLTSARTLGSGSAGRACGLQSLTAVASLGTRAIVGAACRQPGVVGIFAQTRDGWRLDPLTLPAALGDGQAEVLGMRETPYGLTALLGITKGEGTSLVTASTASGGGWDLTPALTVAPGERLVSFGPSSGIGVYVLLATASSVMRLAVADGATAGWQQLPPPPPGTATIAFGPAAGAPIDALAPHDTTLVIWSLGQEAGPWVQAQVLHVKIEFGSSS